MPYVSGAVEGLADESIFNRLCDFIGFDVHFLKICGGKSKLDQKLQGYNSAARYGFWLVLRDLDHDADCAPTLCQDLLPDPSPMMLLRIVVREAESWLLADGEMFSTYFSVARGRIPPRVEELEDPKATVIGLAQRSRRRDIREDMVPRPGSGGKEGPAYASRLQEFATYHWRPDVAAESSDSLRRCMDRMQEWLQEAPVQP